ncbi:glycoside hydrolase family 17 protein [Cucurbitaria berberidis CBS 394.84]|uniref:Probable beta-glucosidase btgE n=1 Tax=Cucurbitaria berberidis CBS 394.84 TaxID=1168544 RepID=A0A9P4G7P4_9PLEO|nr:glycoside hydrolase family 17 protein [Cucurbitaria berberidis CBS 394.84]KAF1840568.1 glycoside hydrolase family 17 protein [Cucurbitaria berberidis CBS 394.84]
MKASIIAASVALAGTVAASQHKAHAGFHLRRAGYESNDVCTVYTTVYVTALPPVVHNSTIIGHSTSTPCSEGEKTPIYTPHVPSSTTEAPKPSKEAYPPAPPAPKPESSKQVQPPAPVPETSKQASPPAPVPATSKPAYTPVPQSSKSVYIPVPVPSISAYVPVPVPSKSVYTPVPVSSKSVNTPVVPVPSKPAYTPVAPPTKPTKPTETPKPAPSSSKAVEKPKPKPTTSKSADKPKPTGGYTSGGRIVTNGNKWAITYTPYANSGQCKTVDEIKSDVKQISELGFTTIRSYSTDCGVFEHVVPECQKYGLKVIYGIFLEGGGKGGKGPFSNYANDQLEGIKSNAPKDSVAMVIVGNECMFNNNCQPADLAAYIDYVREQLHGAGFPKDIAITTTEPVGTWEEKGAELCDHIDIFTVQVHPYFTQSVSAEEAGDFAAQQLEQAAKVCPGAASKGKYITEIGWPSAGNSNGKAIPGVYEQKVAMKKIIEKVGSEACLFSFQNDGWKAPGALNVEQNFGCIEALQ